MSEGVPLPPEVERIIERSLASRAGKERQMMLSRLSKPVMSRPPPKEVSDEERLAKCRRELTVRVYLPSKDTYMTCWVSRWTAQRIELEYDRGLQMFSLKNGFPVGKGWNARNKMRHPNVPRIVESLVRLKEKLERLEELGVQIACGYGRRL